MFLDNLDLPQETAKALQTGLNDLRDDYLDDLFDLRLQAETAAEEVIEEHGNDLTLLRESYADYARKTTELANRYYASVRDLWDTLADVDMPAFSGISVDSDEAVWKQFGGVNNTDHPGYTYESIRSGRNNAGLNVDDMWDLGVRNLDSNGLRKLAGQIVRNTARLTIENSAMADPTHPHYARVPSGTKTCAFCAMLASRGFVYSTERTAGGEDGKYHDNCDCLIIPSWGKSKLRGYNPDRWKKIYDEAARKSGSTDPKRIARWSRYLYPEEFTDGSPQKRRASFADETLFIGMRGQEPNSLSDWNKRQEAVGIPMEWDVLEMHEIVFAERFKKLGHRFEWIPKDEVGHTPTNDFLWLDADLEVEVKSTKSRKPDYSKLSRLISNAVASAARQNVSKDSFILDLGDYQTPEKLLRQLSEYNQKHMVSKESMKQIIKRLYLLDGSGFRQIPLK